ncbi:MAG TPA: hypothetical protein VIV82_10430, partial [Verrucomicrobiae bacterium]
MRDLKPIVVVLGMHRSGTSLLTHLLSTLGVELGEKLVAADGNNEAGYWEQEEIYRTQDALLDRIGRRWISSSGTLPFPDQWWRLPEAQPFKARLIEIVRGELNQTKDVWAFKDPRTSRLLPMWEEIFAELQLKPIYLLAVREPTAVVSSVVKRDEIPAARAELLWLLHNLDVIRDAGDQLRLVVDYDRWFSHPQEQARAVVKALENVCPKPDDAALSRILTRIQPELRHCRKKGEIVLPFVTEAYQLLKRAAGTNQIPAELKTLDAEVRRALGLCFGSLGSNLNDVGAGDRRYSFAESFTEGRLETLGETAGAAVWDVKIGNQSDRCLMLHPPARLHFKIANGEAAKLQFAIAVHPDAWEKPNAGGCEFHVVVDRRVKMSIALDPINIPSDRRWHEIMLDIPRNTSGEHEVILETR